MFLEWARSRGREGGRGVVLYATGSETGSESLEKISAVVCVVDIAAI